MIKKNSGQSLIEVVVAFDIGAIMITTAGAGMALVLRSNEISNKNQVANSLLAGLKRHLKSKYN